MATLKLNKKIFLIPLIILSTVYTCSRMHKQQEESEKKLNIGIGYCKRNPIVAQTYYNISWYEYNEKKIIDIKVILLRKGKNIKTLYEAHTSEKYISFHYEDIKKLDTIQVTLYNDIYYIHSFENNYWLGYKPRGCFLTNYKINNKEYYDSLPNIKEFRLMKELLVN